MIPLAPLWADAGDWVKIAFVIVPVVIYALNRLLAGEGQPQKPPLRRPEPARPVRPVAAPAERKRIDDEVGDFLRRASQQRAAAQQQPAERGRPAPPAAPKPVRRLVERPPELQPVEIEAVDVAVLDDVQAGRSVAAHVQQHLGSRAMAQRGPKGEEVEQAVQELQSHLHETFDHQIGHLATRPLSETTPDAAPKDEAALSAAQQLRVLLSSSQGMGQAIVLGEVLRRPEERW